MAPNLDGCLNNNIKRIRTVPLWQRLRIHIKLKRKYPSKFKNIHKQFPLKGQGISGCRSERSSLCARNGRHLDFIFHRGEIYGSFVFIWGGDPVSAGTLGNGYMNLSQKYKALIYG